MVHFREDAHGHLEKIHLSLSEADVPLRWVPLNGGEPALEPTTGTTGVRDPAICQDSEGLFHILATDLRVFGGDGAGWEAWSSHGSRNLLIWDSPDLLTWSGPRPVEVAPATAGMAWAPEVIRDPGTGEHVVFWSSRLFDAEDGGHTGPSRTRILCSRTRDFRSFSPAEVMFDNGRDVIDTAVALIDGLYHRVSKNEEADGEGLGIMHEVGSGLFSDDYRLVACGIARDLYRGVEAPILLQGRDGRTFLFLDQYSVAPQGYFVLESEDPASGRWRRVDDAEVRIRPATKHGGILPLTRAQWQALDGSRAEGSFC
ncbi:MULTISPECIES: glycoside hydrolase family 43 protein [unclassified Actinomyces]|uniref:glycoside hydrolase family 43 protein n=1 Tax=unclassified Actinomyces TaxID=2609248 RepID=UPI0020178D6F|nr:MULTISPECIES: glycoside hydrolase family 43 protein [unclassified Actinomyces]MCL3777145.1 glycoside hydrolase family 43 protein [Actinomyces sp. AC-20-1]MCL3788939.1 glycoside hydrolase family 43 protein [Actinomyces sp. 187325]MCL3791331.1 glycoside hydrolase family 43 protein [Actinomyces sp. 186855]MCL3794162.1 glycoside hydrolase family 43 protein [Actinomyces sp. 217892]